MSKITRAAVPAAVFSALMIWPSAQAAAQTPPPKPLTIHVEQAAGAPSDVPGINQIDVALTLAFDGPVKQADLEGIVLSGSGSSVPPTVLKKGQWNAPDVRSLRLALPLEEILKSGLKYALGTTTIDLECVLTLRGGRIFVGRVPFDAGNYEGATAPFREMSGTVKPKAGSSDTPKAAKAYVAVIVTKPNPDKKGPFDDSPLAVPMAGAVVAIDFERAGERVHLEEAMPQKGEIRVEVPFDAPVTLKWEKETRTVTCTAKQPVQTVVFSTLKLKTVSTSPIR